MNVSSRSIDNISIYGILQSIASAFRTTFHTSLRTSPGQLAFWRDMIIPTTYLTNWHNIATFTTTYVKINLASNMIIKLEISFFDWSRISSVSCLQKSKALRLQCNILLVSLCVWILAHVNPSWILLHVHYCEEKRVSLSLFWNSQWSSFHGIQWALLF